MQSNDVSAFLAVISNDEALLNQVLGAEDLNGVVTIASEAGFSITTAELIKYHAEELLQLDDDALLEVYGGMSRRAKIGMVSGAAAVLGAGWGFTVAGIIIAIK